VLVLFSMKKDKIVKYKGPSEPFRGPLILPL